MRRVALIVALVAMTGFVPQASAKDGVRAKLDAPVRLGAAPGTKIRAAWHLVDRRGHHFGASGIYLRLSRCGRKPLRIRATQRGDGYSARFTVPRRGIRRVVVGLEGWRTIGRHTERADALFAFAPPLRRRCA